METHIKALLETVAEREGCSPSEIDWYSWPETFGTTGGPGGIGGNMLTSFQVMAFDPPSGRKQKYCAGKWKHWNGEFEEKW
jgi:hypothetical protein